MVDPGFIHGDTYLALSGGEFPASGVPPGIRAGWSINDEQSTKSSGLVKL